MGTARGDGSDIGPSREPVALLAAEAANRFVDRADLTDLLIVGADLEGASAQQALFSGSLFRDCTFRRCNFRRCDFEGVAFEGCRFVECDLSIADLRSVEAGRTVFADCRFDEGSTSSSRFLDCVFERCTYPLHGFADNSVDGCKFIGCNFAKSTVLHSNFTRTIFDQSDLADCTSQYHLFIECQFIRCRLNAEAIGLVFGLTRENLMAIGLTWRGENVPLQAATADELIHDLVVTYQTRGWLFPAAILGLNFAISHRLSAFEQVFATIERSARSALPLKADEIRFFAKVIEHLSSTGKSSLIAVVRGLDHVARAVELRSEHDLAPLRLLYYALKDAEHQDVTALESALSALHAHPSDSMLRVALIFDKPPTVSLNNWFTELRECGGLSSLAPEFIEAVRGSYVEYYLMTLQTLATIVIALSMLERIVDRLTILRVRTKTLFASRLPALITRRGLQPIASPSEQLVHALRKWFDVFSVPSGENVVADTESIAKEVKRIEVDPGPEDQPEE
jgi:uncharacterized protein YjbI with pentapeptide repeats